MRSEPAAKTCRCGLYYTINDYLALPAPPSIHGDTMRYQGDPGEPDQILLFRNCPCGQTLTIDLERVS